MATPFFSIITCTYNSAQFLPAALDSLTAQTCQNFEHIIVDAFSTDGTTEIIQQYQQAHPGKVKVLQRLPKGIAAAMTDGAKAASGTVVYFLNSDDRLAHAAVLAKVQQAFLNELDKSWYIGDQDFIDVHGQVTRHYSTPAYTYERLTRTNYIPHQATFIKRDLLQQLGWFQPYRYGMDYDLWLKMGNTYSPIQTQETIAEFREHAGSATTREQRRAELELYRIRKQLKRTTGAKLRDWANLVISLIRRSLWA